MPNNFFNSSVFVLSYNLHTNLPPNRPFLFLWLKKVVVNFLFPTIVAGINNNKKWVAILSSARSGRGWRKSGAGTSSSSSTITTNTKKNISFQEKRLLGSFDWWPSPRPSSCAPSNKWNRRSLLTKPRANVINIF